MLGAANWRACDMMRSGRGLEVSHSWLSPAWRPGPATSGGEPPSGNRHCSTEAGSGAKEFERLYALRPDLKKAQLIEGVVYMPSPVRVAHSEPHAMILGILLVYSAFTPGVHRYDNATVRLDLNNEP